MMASPSGFARLALPMVARRAWTLIGAVLLSCMVSGVGLPAGATPVSPQQPVEQATDFALVRDGYCDVACTELVSAEGDNTRVSTDDSADQKMLDVATGSTKTEDPRSNGVVDRLPGEDASCDAVNRAYQNTVGRGSVQDAVYEVGADSNSLFAESRWIGRFAYSHQIQEVVWGRWQRIYLQTMEDGRPVFSNCHPINASVSGPRSLKYEAHYERRGSTASATIWIEDDRMARIERHFDPGKSPYPFAVSLEIFTDDGRLEVPLDKRPALGDESCAAVNAAYGRTVDTPRYSYRINATRSGESAVVRAQVRVTDSALYLKRNDGGWSKHYLPIQLLTTPQGALFHLCVRQSATKAEVHYSAWLLDDGVSIPIEIWVSSATGKFTRTSRNYSATGQMYNARIVEQVFTYEPSSAAPPKQYNPGSALTTIWAADNDLR